MWYDFIKKMERPAENSWNKFLLNLRVLLNEEKLVGRINQHAHTACKSKTNNINEIKINKNVKKIKNEDDNGNEDKQYIARKPIGHYFTMIRQEIFGRVEASLRLTPVTEVGLVRIRFLGCWESSNISAWF